MANRGRGRGKGRVYGQAPQLPPGEVLTDFNKRQWTLGKKFASGGFGHIYLAKQNSAQSTRSESGFVVKMEPAENGPLFSEIHVYQRIAKADTIDQWQRKQGIHFLGIPPFIGAGLHVRNGTSFRFMVMPEYGSDLEKIRIQNGGDFPPKDVFQIGISCLNILHYLHDQSYVHADLKADNLLLEKPKSQDLAKIFLVDFGLARRVTSAVYVENPKKAHDGTLIFTSLDAHKGANPSFRGDVEILGYNLVLWLFGHLPWQQNESNPDRVMAGKISFRQNPAKSLKPLANDHLTRFLQILVSFFEHVFALEYAERPDYELLIGILHSGLDMVKLKAVPAKTSPKRSQKSRPLKRKSSQSPETLRVPLPSASSRMSEREAARFQKSPDLFDDDSFSKKSGKSARISLDKSDSSLSRSRREKPSTSRFEPPKKGEKIPGAANLAPKRRSIEQSVVKKYIGMNQKKMPVLREKNPAIVNKTRRKQRDNQVEFHDQGTQTAPEMWPVTLDLL